MNKDEYACALDHKRAQGKPAPEACWGIKVFCPVCHNYKLKKALPTSSRRRR